MPKSFTTPCGFFVVIGRHGNAVKINFYWQDKPVDINVLDLSLAGARMIATKLAEVAADATVL